MITVMIYATGHLSGAHINPAVTAAFCATRHFPLRDAALYIPSQLAGRHRRRAPAPGALGRHTRRPRIDRADRRRRRRVVYEGVMTAFLMFVIVAVATDTRAVGQAAAIAIGGTVALDALFGGPVTGASMNPARSFGPALVSGTWDDFWVYVVGPALGALLGAVAYVVARRSDPGEKPA